MRLSRLARMAIILVALTVGVINITHAQSSPISAQVDRSSVSTDDTLILTATVSGGDANLPQPDMPVLDGFNVITSGSSSQISIINGAVSAQVVYTFKLQPYQTGTLTIGAFSVTLDGQTYTSDPLDIEVTQGTGQPQSGGSAESLPAPSSLDGQQVFVEAVVDNETPYIGEQIIYSFRLYQAVSLFSQPQYSPPDFTGFWHDQQPEQQQYQTQVDNITYRVQELQTVLFPTSVGEITIDPTTLIIPGGFFESDTRLQTDALTLNVKPLPDGAPDDFSGAVGQYTLDATVDSSSIQAGDPVTLRISIAGTGNIDALPEPTWETPSNWRSFEAKSTTDVAVHDGKLEGSKVFERLLIPSNGGDYTLPAVTLTYFDPQTAAYYTASSEPIAVAVSGDAGATMVESSTGQAEIAASAGANSPEVVLAPLKDILPDLQLAPLPLTDNPLYWLSWSVPLFMMGGTFAYERRQRYLHTNAVSLRRSRAFKQAQRALKHAHKQSGDRYKIAGRILAEYLEAKLNHAINGLTHAQLTAILTQNGISEPLAEQAITALYYIDVLRFGQGATTTAQDILNSTETLITGLEKEFLS